MKSDAPESEKISAAALDLGSASEQVQQVRAAASALLEKAKSASSVTDEATAVEKAAGALKLAAELGKTRTELIKVNEEISKLKRENQTASKRERSEQIRDYVALLTPLGTIITLAATLVVQNWQFLRSESDRREEALDARWNDAVKTISTSGALSPGVIALQPFLRSPKYGEQARDVAVNLMASSSDPTFFGSLFSTALVPVSWSNIDPMLRLDRALAARQLPLATKTWDEAKGLNDTTRFAKDELLSWNYIDQVVPTITAQIGGVLKTPRPPGTQIDLSSTYFEQGDWKGIDLEGANLDGARFTGMDLQDAELKGVTQFNGAAFYNTAWWKVKSITRPLLEYFETYNPFNHDRSYGPQSEIISQQEYDAAIRRLTSQLK